MNQITLNSKIKDIYNNPIGNDIFDKILLQLGLGEWTVNNPLIGNLTLNQLKKIVGKKVGEGFYNTLITILNNETEIPKNDKCEIIKKWWKESVFYQIYPRSFMDSNGDGVGDIKGIISKLDYLKKLGIDAIWLSPIYDSPNDDNGYDIRDYYKISNEYGNMEDFETLLNEVHSRGMKIIMDLVVNHTSDEHIWFQTALKEENSKYSDYYLFKPSNNENPPNNWQSFFSGSAWNYYETKNQWALHLFTKKQMDLNWDNAELRSEIYEMIKWWLQKGVDGFRLDVINYISKMPGLPNGDEFIGKLMGYYGIEHYFYGPNLHKYLKEMKNEVFKPYDAFSVGETPGIGMEMSKLLTGDYRGELDMVFSFDLLEMPGKAKFDNYLYDLNYLKKYMITWMKNYGNHYWMSLFYDNHDNPRMLSKIDPSGKHREVLSKLLATIQLTLKGTPFIFQGQELGAINRNFKSINEIRDVESINLYNELTKKMSEESALNVILTGSRDHARTPMNWNGEENGGFTKGTPWISGNFDEFHAEGEENSENSIWNFYRKLIKIRKRSECLRYGDVTFVNESVKNLLTYYRKNGNEIYFIECNLSPKSLVMPYERPSKKLLISNYKTHKKKILRPYEANILKI